MRCPKCNREVPNEACLCFYCGTKIESKEKNKSVSYSFSEKANKRIRFSVGNYSFTALAPDEFDKPENVDSVSGRMIFSCLKRITDEQKKYVHVGSIGWFAFRKTKQIGNYSVIRELEPNVLELLDVETQEHGLAVLRRGFLNLSALIILQKDSKSEALFYSHDFIRGKSEYKVYRDVQDVKNKSEETVRDEESTFIEPIVSEYKKDGSIKKTIGIVGEFMRGRSTVINALLGTEVLPTGIMLHTAVPIFIRWGEEICAELTYRDGSTKNVSVDCLNDYLSTEADSFEKQAELMDYATVFCPSFLCKNDIQFVDMPGLCYEERFDRIVKGILPFLDIAIMVVSSSSPFSVSEAEYVRNMIIPLSIERIIFVVNKIDQVDDELRGRIIDHIKGKISSCVLEVLKAENGEDSDEYKSAVDKLGEIKVIGVSAKQALEAKMNNDPILLEKSGFIELENLIDELI